MKCSDKLVSEPVLDDFGCMVDQLVTEERVGKSALYASVESPQTLITTLLYPLNS